MAASTGEVSAMSDQKLSSSGVKAILHPLPILEVSDYITRASEQGYEGAIVGALLGQADGREITIEHSFPVKTASEGGSHKVDSNWFHERLAQMKLVHKDPQLDLVGWYTLVPKEGPTSIHALLHEDFSRDNDGLVLLGLHLAELLQPTDASLPITIYEGELEHEAMEAMIAEEDLKMTDASDRSYKFRELPYVTEAGEAEMIAMQFIREGGANASLEGGNRRTYPVTEMKAVDGKGKGKRRAVLSDEMEDSAVVDSDILLSKEEAEYVSALQAKASAIKMMKSRIAVVIAYLQKLPPDFTRGNLSTAEAAELAAGSDGQYLRPSHKILRQIQALVTNAALVSPAQSRALEEEIRQESNDVELLSLVSALVASVDEVRETSKKFAISESGRLNKARHAQESVNYVPQSLSGPGDLML